ncbi:hypothetical protein CFOL_v3_35406 [Cephalotus follicularis]|uniref:Protein Lines C-terminal domain-containing protein n=1 Tax=Cephalotus follicularis TaxID=3775 RepID=A0A1Q3DHW0_CEPFO|nr:hypothetical protein CFOL_v3_35406 [Cephalotus follicularis]
MAKMMADLISLLTVESQYVQHLAGNVLVIISEFLAASGSKWVLFMQLLCVCLELAITNVLSSSLAPSVTGPEDSSCDSSSFVFVLKPRLKNANWSAVAGIIHVLRKILKYLKQEDDNNLSSIYLDTICSCLSNVAWDFIDRIRVVQDGHTPKIDAQNSCADAFYLRYFDLLMFLGSFVQLLCSLVEEIGFMDVKGNSSPNHPFFCVIINLLPKLLCCCLLKQGDRVNGSIYIRHKLLVLMVRLSFQTCLDSSIYVSWLQLLHEYFQDFLLKPITLHESGQADCLEGSPFLLTISDGEVLNVCTRHLQRLAIFLFLRSSFSLIRLKEDNTKKCECATANAYLTFDSISDLACCSTKKGLLELYKWLQGIFPADMFVDLEMYMENCINFSTSFIQLYMHEDDLLFEVLLLLLHAAFLGEQQFQKERWQFQNLKEHILFHVSNLLNPIRLFHIFIAELHYDHQVLLDYLISKDTGISCAEYLLKCLRMICDSWHLFMEITAGLKVTKWSSRQRTIVLLKFLNFQAKLPFAHPENLPFSPEKECMNDSECGDEHFITRGQSYIEAKNCLLSLKDSVENLHLKKLFPYNPEVLLKRLARFQELCIKQEGFDLSMSGDPI